jgi:hypothetical protein
MIVLSSLTSLEIILAAAMATVNSPITSYYAENITATGDYSAGNNIATTNGTTAVAVVAAPGAGITRHVKYFTLVNTDTAPITPIVRLNFSGGFFPMFKCILAVGDQLQYTDTEGIRVFDSNGNVKTLGLSTGRLIRAPQILTSGTSYAPPVGCTAIEVECVAGGGGGGGCTSSASNGAAGAGGASGGFVSKYFANPPATCAYAIGAAGTAGANTGGTGGTGGDSTFTVSGTTITAKGGLGGVGMVFGTTVLTSAGGAGVISTNGDLNGSGDPGDPGIRMSGTIGASGPGGSSQYGAGGAGRTTGGAGNVGVGPGSGGGGGLVLNGSGAVIGGAGTAGIIRIWEYY